MPYVLILSWSVCIMLLRDTAALNDSCLSPVKKQNRVITLTKEVPGMEKKKTPKIKLPSPPSNALPAKGT